MVDDVILATVKRSDGPWTGPFGCYGVSVNTGKLLWVSHVNGLYGKFLRMLDGVPGLTNQLRDDPLTLVKGRVLMRRGRLMDPASGRCLERDKELVKAYSKESLIDDHDHPFYYGRAIRLARSNGRTIRTCPVGKTLLAQQMPGVLHDPYDLGFYRYAENGQLQWSKTAR